MDKKIVLIVMMLVLSATAFPAAGLLPMKAGSAEQTKQTEPGTTGRSASNDVWPMFRHDAGNTGCSQFFAPNTNHLAWKHQIGTNIYQSTPILYADKLYISTNFNSKGPPKITNIFDTPPSSPSEFLQSLFEHKNNASPGLYCLDAKTGDQLWSRPMNTPTDPAIVDNKIYVTDTNLNTYMSELYCLDAATGNTIWQKSINSVVLSPTIVANEKIYLGGLDMSGYYGSVQCYDLSGNLLWNHPLQTYEALWFSAPAVSGNNIYFITSNIYSYYTGNLYCLNAATGQFLWSHPVFSFGYAYSLTPSAVCADANVYVVDFNIDTYEGSLICYNGTTGTPEWTCYLGGALSFASPTVCEDSVYLIATSVSSYENWLYRIDSTNGTYLWRVPLPYSSYFGFGSPICSADKILVSPGSYGGYSNELYCFEREDGMQDWQFMTDSYILGGPSIGNGRAYVADNAGNIYAFEDVLKVQAVLGGFLGVNALIQNTGNATLTNISWNISVVGGSLGMINRTGFGTIQELQAGKIRIIRLIPIIGLGNVEIIVKATMPDMSTIKKVKQGLVLGSVCLILR